MELPSKVRYTLLALLKLASHYEQGDYLQIEQMIANQQIPGRYLSQLLMMLRRCGLVQSQRGAKGGYLLAKDPSQITLFEILACLKETKQNPDMETQKLDLTLEKFVVKEVWQEVTIAANAVWQHYTLKNLRERCDENQNNPMYYI